MKDSRQERPGNLQVTIAFYGSKGVGKSELLKAFRTEEQPSFLTKEEIENQIKDGLLPADTDPNSKIQKEAMLISYADKDLNTKGNGYDALLPEYRTANTVTPNADAYVLVFNPDNRQSFLDVQEFAAKIREKKPNSKFYLISNVRKDKDGKDLPCTVDWEKDLKPFMKPYGIKDDSEFFSFDVTLGIQRPQVCLRAIADATLKTVLQTAAKKTESTPTQEAKATSGLKEGSTSSYVPYSPSSSSSSSSASSGTSNHGREPIYLDYEKQQGYKYKSAKPKASFQLKALAVISGVLLLASLVALTLGSCGVGPAAVALGLMIGGTIGTALTFPLFANSSHTLWKIRKAAREDGPGCGGYYSPSYSGGADI